MMSKRTNALQHSDGKIEKQQQHEIITMRTLFFKRKKYTPRTMHNNNHSNRNTI